MSIGIGISILTLFTQWRMHGLIASWWLGEKIPNSRGTFFGVQVGVCELSGNIQIGNLVRAQPLPLFSPRESGLSKDTIHCCWMGARVSLAQAALLPRFS